MKIFIDSHNHCTWGVDDGIQTQAESKIALAKAKADGIHELIVTPHFIPGRFQIEDYEEIGARMKALQTLAKIYDVKVHLGSEVFLNDDYLAMVEDQLFYPLANSKYILVEFDVRKPVGDERDVEDRFYELLLRGYKPVIAHTERYFHNGMNLERVAKWVNMGCYIQVNRTSLLRSGLTHKNATALLSAGLVHLVASDMHSNEGQRVGILSDAYDYIHHEYGEMNADLLCLGNPQRIIKDESLVKMDIVKKKKTLLWFLKRGK